MTITCIWIYVQVHAAATCTGNKHSIQCAVHQAQHQLCAVGIPASSRYQARLTPTNQIPLQSWVQDSAYLLFRIWSCSVLQALTAGATKAPRSRPVSMGSEGSKCGPYSPCFLNKKQVYNVNIAAAATSN